MSEAPVVARPPWWRRIFRKRVYNAGDRREVARSVNWVRPLLLLAVLLGLVLVCALPGRGLIDRGVTELMDRVSAHVPVTPVAVRASSTEQGAAPENVKDVVANRYWAPAGPAEGAWVEVDLKEAVRLLDVIVTPGVSGDKKEFLEQGRPKELDVTVTDTRGRTHTTTIKLRDEPGGQRFSVKASDAVRVRFTIRSSYGVPPGRLVAVAELEFFARG